MAAANRRTIRRFPQRAGPSDWRIGQAAIASRHFMHEHDQLTQLGRMRQLATGLLFLMALIFVTARLLEPRYAYLAFVGAFAEAAMVGALADWFAVTALFRRPLGLPIPHTAIIPTNKDRIGESISNFLEHNFMTREVLSDELKQVDFAGTAAAWLAVPENSRAVATQLVAGIPALIRMVEDEDIGAFMQRAVTRAVQNTRFAPIAAEVLSVLVADRRHQAVFDHLIRLAANALEQNRPFIRQKIHEQSPRWMPRALDEKLFIRLLEGAQNVLDEMRQEDSEWRDQFQQAAEDLIERLRSSPDYEQKISGAIQHSLQHPLFLEYIEQVWRDVKGKVLADAASDDSVAVAQLDKALRGLSQALMQDETVQDKINTWIRSFAVEAIFNRRQVIADLVKRVIRNWDADTVSQKFELYVGKDLQYIRINGTLVGGLVGLLLHVISLALWA
jgi:uncharacterized membrane-anchored protein YjiN (DUF445 family)